VRLYLEFARRSFQQQFAYRGATLAGIFTNGVFGVMIATIFVALYRSQSDGGTSAVEGWSRDQTVTMVWISQSLLMTVYIWGWWEVTRNIQSGAIVNELLKPYDYFSYWLSRDLGRALAHLFIRGIPTFAIGMIFFTTLSPVSVVAGTAFLLSIALAVTASFCLRFLANLAGFWVIDYRGLQSAYNAVVTFFSGMLIPLAFLPGPFKTAANIMPFRSIIMMPGEIYLGHITVWKGLGFQALWIALLVLACRALLSVGERQLVVQGG
jgi:ABC-2 type transport system permease protein